ncbi:hypothetical protein RvY_12814 [Ramazzottius varieornatus]|uniref:Uncharacterized protein n=1 Tax=Ramazzottius varieornatus TaxID=947166 RepID=A0A1D1VKT1_RAMVA|nr:hypothetical protein RvY_12814 [Ramazzottius varieornatus]
MSQQAMGWSLPATKCKPLLPRYSPHLEETRNHSSLVHHAVLKLRTGYERRVWREVVQDDI